VKRADLVLVTVDGWDGTGVDPFATAVLPRAVRFTNLMTACPQVRPAVATMLTGQGPEGTETLDDLTRPLPAQVPYLPEMLAKAGWQTAAFVANPHVGHGSGLDRGFETFDAPPQPMIGPFRYQPWLRSSHEVLDNVKAWTGSLAAERPFFAWIHLAYGGMSGPPPKPGVSEEIAWNQLAALLGANGRLGDAAVVVVRTAGAGDDGGYFLTPAGLRAALLLRPAAGKEAPAWKPGDPLRSTDVAAFLAAQAGVPQTFPDAVSTAASVPSSRVRLAGTWRGARDFGWPVQRATLRDDALVLTEQGGDPPRAWSWTAGTALPPGIDPAPENAAAEAQARPVVPAAVEEALGKAGVTIPASAPLPPAPSQSVRESVLPLLLEARGHARQGQGEAAVALADRALRKDPGNVGARVEPAVVFVLTGKAAKARPRLEAALHLYPYSAEAWHWLAHVALLERATPKAEAMLRLADFLDPHNPDVLYDLACARSLAGDVPGAEEHLRRAWAAGYRDADHIEADADLRNLRADPRYARFMQEVVR